MKDVDELNRMSCTYASAQAEKGLKLVLSQPPRADQTRVISAVSSRSGGTDWPDFAWPTMEMQLWGKEEKKYRIGKQNKNMRIPTQQMYIAFPFSWTWRIDFRCSPWIGGYISTTSSHDLLFSQRRNYQSVQQLVKWTWHDVFLYSTPPFCYFIPSVLLFHYKSRVTGRYTCLVYSSWYQDFSHSEFYEIM